MPLARITLAQLVLDIRQSAPKSWMLFAVLADLVPSLQSRHFYSSIHLLQDPLPSLVLLVQAVKRLFALLDYVRHILGPSVVNDGKE